MLTSESDLSGIATFLAVADARSFRVAADRLGVTRPAVSQALRRLEDRLGLALVHRTTRSVSLTEAGERLRQRLAPAVAEADLALAEARDRDARPSGLLRLAVSSIADAFISGPLLAAFTEHHPGVALDITITDETFDIVAAGYDAGVRLGEVIGQDMIAVPVSGPQRQVAVASPGHLARHGVPRHPRDLLDRPCIGWRPTPQAAPYRWEFTENGRDFALAVSPRITTNDMGLMIRTALAGAGITFGLEESFRPYLARGELVAVLETYGSFFPGFFLYFPARRHLAPKLRALIDHARTWRRADG